MVVRFPRLAAAFVLIFLAGPQVVVHGQAVPVAPDSTQIAEHELVLATRDLLASIQRDTAALGDLRRQAEGVTGEELRVLERRHTRASIEVLARIGSLVTNVLTIEGDGDDAAEFRVPAESMLQAIDARAHGRVDELNDAMNALGSEREQATPDQLVGIEARLAEREAELNAILLATLDNIENMERLGMATEAQREHLAEVLQERADASISRIDLARSRAAAIQGRLARSPDDADLKASLEAAQARTQRVTASLSSTIAMMRRLDLDATEYQQALIQATGQITTDIFDRGVALGLVRQGYTSFKDRLIEDGPGSLFQAILILLILLATHFVARIAQNVVKAAVSRPRLELSRLLQNTLGSMSGAVVRVVGVLIAFSQLGFSLAPLLAGVGIVGFIVGFALQDTLANFAAGMMILIYRPFDVGDVVEAAGASGKVSKMSLVSTTIMTFDNQALIVPNGKIWGDVIKNVTAQRVRRVDLTFGIGYADDIPKTEIVLMEILKEHPKVLSKPAPNVRLHNLGESSVDFIVRPWVKTDDYWDVYWDVTREVKMRFDREGISIPFPQRDVHVYEVPPAPDVGG